MIQLHHTRYMQVIRSSCFEWHQPIISNKAALSGKIFSFSVINDDTIIWPWYKQLC
jgi:hypothetical protein